jgi:hypothetical protein
MRERRCDTCWKLEKSNNSFQLIEVNTGSYYPSYNFRCQRCARLWKIYDKESKAWSSLFIVASISLLCIPLSVVVFYFGYGKFAQSLWFIFLIPVFMLPIGFIIWQRSIVSLEDKAALENRLDIGRQWRNRNENQSQKRI